MATLLIVIGLPFESGWLQVIDSVQPVAGKPVLVTCSEYSRLPAVTSLGMINCELICRVGERPVCIDTLRQPNCRLFLISAAMSSCENTSGNGLPALFIQVMKQ